eukprot:31026-Pelagococcus_subviridis.AAC.4
MSRSPDGAPPPPTSTSNTSSSSRPSLSSPFAVENELPPCASDAGARLRGWSSVSSAQSTPRELPLATLDIPPPETPPRARPLSSDSLDDNRGGEPLNGDPAPLSALRLRGRGTYGGGAGGATGGPTCGGATTTASASAIPRFISSSASADCHALTAAAYVRSPATTRFIALAVCCGTVADAIASSVSAAFTASAARSDTRPRSRAAAAAAASENAPPP